MNPLSNIDHGEQKRTEFRANILGVRVDRVPILIGICVLAIAYYFTALVGLEFAIPPGNATAVWPASGIALAALLTFGWRTFPGIWIAAFLINLTTDVSFWIAAAFATGNTLEGLMALSLCKRFLYSGRPIQSIYGAFLFVFVCAVSCAVAATFGALGLVLGGYLEAGQFLSNWGTWWFGDLTGMMLVTPFFLTAPRVTTWPARSRKTAEAVVVLLALGVVSQGIFGGWLPENVADRLLHLPLIFLVWLLLRFDIGLVFVANLLIATIAVWGTSNGVGAFASDSMETSLLDLQVFLIVYVFAGLALAGIVNGQREAEWQKLKLAEEISKRDRRYRQIVETAKEGIAILDENERFVFVNKRYAEMFGYSVEELIGRSFLDVDDESEKSEALDQIARRRMGLSETFVRKSRDKQGNLIWRLISSTPLFDDHGRYEGVLGMSTDISTLRRVEDQLKRSKHLAAVGTLAGGIAHETVNPLSAILTAARHGMARVGQPGADDRLRECFELICEAGERIAKITRSVQQFARHGTFEKSMTDLRPLQTRVVERMKTEARESGIAIELEIADDLPAIEINSTEIEQVYENLIVNAIQSSKPGSTVRICAEGLPERVQITVSDQGKGMTPDVLEHAFDPFFTTRADGGGTGMGLSIVHSVIVAHGGTVDIESEVGRGTVISIQLPTLSVLAVPAHVSLDSSDSVGSNNSAER